MLADSYLCWNQTSKLLLEVRSVLTDIGSFSREVSSYPESSRHAIISPPSLSFGIFIAPPYSRAPSFTMPLPV